MTEMYIPRPEHKFTSNDPHVRAFALQKTLRAIDLGASLGADLYVFWGRRKGKEKDAGVKARSKGYRILG